MQKTVANNPFTKAAPEMALSDIMGKAAGLPVSKPLGGAGREFGPPKFSIPGQQRGVPER